MTDPIPFSDHPTTIAVSGWTIPAALTLPVPDDRARLLPSAILLIPGSLFSDVNGDYPTWNSFPHVYAHLAHKLAALGHAVFRYAKLGPGTGSVMTDPHLAATIRTWDGRVTIAAAALDAMRHALAEHDVRVARIIAAGHSEGAVVVSRLAASDRGAEIDGVVLLSGPSVGILEIMIEQSRAMSPPDQRDDTSRRLEEAVAYVRRGERPPAELAAGEQFGAGALVNMPDEALRYMRDVDATDPTGVARTLTQPVLVLQGANDGSVPAHHAERLCDALNGRDGGEQRTRYLLVPEVTHMYKVVPPEVTGPNVFAYPGETDPRVTDGIDEWIRGLGGSLP